MSITDELREYIAEQQWCAKGTLSAIADRIDAEHERAMADAELAAAPTEAQMAELGYIALPLDADGVPIRVGDRLDGYNRTIDVQEMRWCGDCRWDMVDEYGDEWHDNHAFTHHRAPTVEDVLREFSCVLMGKREFDGDVTEAIAEFAAKLRELVRDLWLTGSLCDAIPDMRLQAKGGDWRTMKERVDEVLGIEVDA